MLNDLNRLSITNTQITKKSVTLQLVNTLNPEIAPDDQATLALELLATTVSMRGKKEKRCFG